MRERPALIVVGASARALAASALRAGFAPLAIDVFGDGDTRALSADCLRLEGGLADGLREAALMPAIDAMAAAYDPFGIVYGSGFDDKPELIAAMARRLRVLGNSAAAMARAKDPLALAELCADCGISHPEIRLSAPADQTGWLVKKRGGAGGGHVSVAKRSAAAPEHYFQRRTAGDSCSALFIADGKMVEMIGLSAQWTAPTRSQPFRYGGAVGPIVLAKAQTEAVCRAVASLTRRLGLVGLNSADFLIDGQSTWLVEINPRPGATLDVFDSAGGPLVETHIAACQGRLTQYSHDASIRAARIVYAPSAMTTRDLIDWPDWSADRPAPGALILNGDPLCTVFATGPTAEMARSCVEERARSIVALVGNAAA
jgi:uncharacterized protein